MNGLVIISLYRIINKHIKIPKEKDASSLQVLAGNYDLNKFRIQGQIVPPTKHISEKIM